MHSSTAILYIFSKNSVFFLYGLATGHSHVASVQHDLTTPSSVLLIPPVFSPSLDGNGGIQSSGDWFIGLLDIATSSDKSDVEGGIDRASGDERLLDNR